MIIGVDAGHGGKDRGAVVEELEEAEWNLRLCLRLGEIMPQLVLLRTFDEYLTHAQRASRAVVRGVDVVLSIHHDSGGPDRRGACLYFLGKEIPTFFNQDFEAKLMSTQSHPHTGDWEYLDRPENCLKRFTKPSVLLEVGFLTDPIFRGEYRTYGVELQAQKIAKWLEMCLR